MLLVLCNLYLSALKNVEGFPLDYKGIEVVNTFQAYERVYHLINPKFLLSKINSSFFLC